MAKCVICNHELSEAFSIGNLYLSDFIPIESKSENYASSDLTIMACDVCGTGSLKETIDPNILYRKYWYYSGINQTMRNALQNVVESCLKSISYEPEDVWLDIASNDGTLLSYVPKSFVRVGIDPADSAIQNLAKRHGTIINDFFSKEAYKVAVPYNKKAKIITCIAMFYDLANPHQFLEDVRSILDDNGLFVIQISYTPLMFHQTEFGNICAEHVMYYSLDGIKILLEQHGLYIVDCELNDINGGSFRIYCTKTYNHHFKNQQERDVASFRINSLLVYERIQRKVENFKHFGAKIQSLKYQTLDYINNVKNKGKTIYGYGASTKGNTLLQYFELNNNIVTKIAERNKAKWGLKTIGSEIPICSEEEMRADNPDYLLILPWHFIEEFKQREQAYLQAGGKFIVPSPKFEVISYGN